MVTQQGKDVGRHLSFTKSNCPRMKAGTNSATVQVCLHRPIAFHVYVLLLAV